MRAVSEHEPMAGGKKNSSAACDPCALPTELKRWGPEQVTSGTHSDNTLMLMASARSSLKNPSMEPDTKNTSLSSHVKGLCTTSHANLANFVLPLARGWGRDYCVCILDSRFLSFVGPRRGSDDLHRAASKAGAPCVL